MLRAQSITSYACDFENPAENAQWVLNEAKKENPRRVNSWYIGEAGGFGLGSSASSSAGLYISDGTAEDTLVASYSNAQSVWVTASRYLPLASGTYSVVFDWEAGGSDETEGVYVFWMEDGPDMDIRSYSNWNDRNDLSLPAWVTNTTRYGGVYSWRSSAFTFSTAGNGGKLVVLWLNKMAPVVNPAGKVDNICVYPGNLCPVPTNVRYNGTNSSVSWRGNASSYDLMLYNYHTKTLSTYTGLTSTSMQMPTVNEEGYYYIYVRSVCEEGHSAWVYTETFVWIKGARCIDVFDIGGDATYAGVCYRGDFDDFIRNNRQGEMGIVNEGSSSPSSMHTIHYRIGEKDPNTTINGGLPTIPQDEIGSVRLGAYTSSGESSRIEYKYHVQAGTSDLLDLKYAVVMESGGHGSSLSDPDMNPTFTLNILDGNGNEIDRCSQVYFVAGFGDPNAWHQEGDIFWCDWSKITVSLRNYVGQTLTIRLTSARCSYDTHPAYAYFTLNCRGGSLEGVACGDFSTDHFEAPEGFYYRWYRDDDPSRSDIKSTERIFNINSDDPTIYRVDLMSYNDPTCFYTLVANPNPRFPQAKARTISIVGRECMNYVDFAQECSVVRINRQTRDSMLTDEPVESIVWDFGDGSEPLTTMDEHVSHVYPAEGGEYDVKVSASMSNGICVDEYTIHLSIPDITSPDEHNETHYCGEGENHTDTTRVTTRVGCEQLKLHHHIYHPTFDTLYSDRICEGGRYYFPGNGRYYTQSIDTVMYLKSKYLCDSIIRLSLIVDPKLEVLYPEQIKVCAEDPVITIPYTVTSGSLDSVRVYFSDEAQQYGFEPLYAFGNDEEVIIPLPENARPDMYDVQLDFGSERCQMETQTMSMMLTYPTNIVMQTGGFIGVQNADYNGGYSFSKFDWYKDGVKTEVRDSYIPAGPEDIGSTYVVILTREGDKYPLESCPILYNPYAEGLEILAGDRTVWPTCVAGGANLHLAPQACTIYTILGSVVARYPQASETRTVAAPSQAGMYVVVFDNNQSSRILVR